MAKRQKKVTLYNPAKDEKLKFDEDHAKRILAYQERVNSKTRFELVEDKKKEKQAK